MKIKLVVFVALLVSTLSLAGCADGRRDYGGYGYGYPSYFGYGGFGGERFRGFHGEGFHGDRFHGGEFHGAGSTVAGMVAVIVSPNVGMPMS
jgi:hypothetical protein